jgi:hypothetical protein
MSMSAESATEIRRLLLDIDGATQRIRTLLDPVPTEDPPPGSAVDFSIIDERLLPSRSFTYRWPTGEAKYVEATRYTVLRDDAEYVFVVGSEEGGRPAYRRADRGRIVVFLRQTASANSYYPLLEFAESDLDADLYAALIPKPGQTASRATADDLDALRGIDHLKQADIRRADEVFTSSAKAPSLRILIPRNDPKALITHSWWVGTLRRTA